MTDPSPTSRVSGLFEVVQQRNPMHHRFLERAAGQLTSNEKQRLETYLGFCARQGLSDADIAGAYLTIVNDTLREQAYFRKHGGYRHKTFAEVADSVYFDDNYMTRYMYGLAISSFLWPNHLDLLRFFRATLPREKPGRYLEIGPGHGYFMLTAMQESAFSDFLGIDISRASIAQTSAIIAHFAPHLRQRVRLEEQDFLTCNLDRGSFDAVVMGEVLEHVEAPGAFLARIREAAAPRAHIYVTTCINAPAVDHIQLFSSTKALEQLFAEADLRIRDALIRPYEGKTVAESLDEKLPINVAYVLDTGG